ncbi:MAG: 50S ribosomal protein L18Ae [Candidatus Diapherotrites archaeon]
MEKGHIEKAATKKHAGSAAVAGGVAAGKAAGTGGSAAGKGGRVKEKGEADFAVSGTFLEKDNYKKFTKIVSAYNEANAREKAFSLMGSKHAVKRRHVKIDSAKEAK